jgi:lysophospholipase L1-like esterase
MQPRLFLWTFLLVAIVWVALRLIRPDVAASFTADVICIGDSLTAGFDSTSRDRGSRSVTFHPYATALETSLGPGTRVLPFGFSGWTSQKLIDHANRRSKVETEVKHGRAISTTQRPGIALAIRKYHPKLVIIMAGTNDVFRLRNPTGADIADRVWKLHMISHRARVRTIALGIPDWSPSRARTAARRLRLFDVREKLNKRLQTHAQNASHLATYVEFPFPFKQDSQLWSQDGLHLTPKGYNELGLRLAEYVLPLLRVSVAGAPEAATETTN